MSLLKNTEFIIAKRAAIIALIVIGIFFFIFPEPKPYVYGIIFGTIINLLNFRLMSLTLSKSVNKPPNKIMSYVISNYIIRYTIYGIVLIVAAKADYISFYTTIAGFFMVKIVILADNFYDNFIKKKNKN